MYIYAAAEAIKSAVGAGSQKAAEASSDLKSQAGAAAEEIKGKATDAGYEAEKLKADAGKTANRGDLQVYRLLYAELMVSISAATEAKKATQ